MNPSGGHLRETRLDGTNPPKYVLDEWFDEFGVLAGITGAESGYSLGLWSDEGAGTALERWRGFGTSFGPGIDQLVVGHQVHGTLVEPVGSFGSGILIREGVDGHATNNTGILLTVLVADCVPVYLFHPPTKAMALLHAGWRGTAAGILGAGIEILATLGARRPSDLVMHCGISVCGSCYQVGPEVVKAVTGRVVSQPEYLDLRAVVRDQARLLGIEKVSTSPYCTVHDADQFHSYRSSGAEAGRMAAYLGVPLS